MPITRTATQQYASTGTQTARLQVRDREGRAASITHTVQVTARSLQECRFFGHVG